MRHREPRAGIVGLLGRYTVEAGGARREVGHAVLPQGEPDTAAAILGPADVEAQKRGIIPEPHDRQAGRRYAVHIGGKKAVRICGTERRRVVKARVPALGLGP
jgi:hypothetical protein